MVKINSEERKKLNSKAAIRCIPDNVLKLRFELEKALRDQGLMAMIADNYDKEIKRRKLALDAPQSIVLQPVMGFRCANSAQLYNRKHLNLIS